MAVIAGTTVNWRLSPRVVTIPVAQTTVSVTDLQDTLLALEDNTNTEDGMLFDHLRNTSGGEDLGGGNTVGFTMELQDTVIAFAPRTTNTSSGTATTANAAGTVLIDSAATFQTDGVLPGAKIVNFTDKSVSSVISVDSETQITHYALADGTENDWDSGDEYKVWNEVQCEVNGGNLVAVDLVPAAINPIRATFGTQVLRTSSSSATISDQSVAETATQTVNEPVSGATSGSLGDAADRARRAAQMAFINSL